MDEGKRLSEIRKYLNLNQSQLATILETTQNNVSLIENGKCKLSERHINCLTEKIYVNSNWLRNGVGEMFLITSAPDFSLTDEQKEKILSNSRFITSDAIPFIERPIDGLFEQYDDEEETKYLVDYPPFNDCSFYRQMFGDSMSPKIKSGDTVACKKVTNINSIIYGEIYLCIYKEADQIFEVLRTIRRCEDNQRISLAPLNPNYDSIVIPKESIKALYIVKGKIERFI